MILQCLFAANMMNRHKDKYEPASARRAHTFMPIEDVQAGKKSQWAELEISGKLLTLSKSWPVYKHSVSCRHHPEPEPKPLEAPAPHIAVPQRQQPAAYPTRDLPPDVPAPPGPVVQQASQPAPRNRGAHHPARALPAQQLPEDAAS